MENLNPQQFERIRALIELLNKDDGQLIMHIFDLQSKFEDSSKRAEELITALETKLANIEALRPVKGQDYATQEEVNALIDHIKGFIPPPEQVDYTTVVNNIVAEVQKEVTKQVKGIKLPTVDVEKISNDIIAKLPTPAPVDVGAIPLPNKMEYFPDTPEVIKEKLLSLEGDDRIDITSWKGADVLTSRIQNWALEILDRRTQFLINKVSGSGGSWIPQGITTDGTHAVPAGTDLGTSEMTLQQIMDMIFYPAQGPTVSLVTSPIAGIVEAGDAISSVDLTPTTTQGSLPITTLTLSGTDGYAYSYPTPSPSGATEPTQTDSTGFVTTTTYTATVGDGTYTGTATKTFTYVFPYYKGVQIVNYPTASIDADGGTLTKVVSGNPFTLTLSFTTVAQVPYLVYPASYGKLKKVLDVSNFDVSTDWGTQAGGPNTDITPWATTTVTNSFGATASCYVYQFANVTTTTQQYTFSQ